MESFEEKILWNWKLCHLKIILMIMFYLLSLVEKFHTQFLPRFHLELSMPLNSEQRLIFLPGLLHLSNIVMFCHEELPVLFCSWFKACALCFCLKHFLFCFCAADRRCAMIKILPDALTKWQPLLRILNKLPQNSVRITFLKITRQAKCWN